MLHVGDAVGQHTLAVQALLRAAGSGRRSTSSWTTPRRPARPGRRPPYPDEARPDDVLVYQFATASALAAWLADGPRRLVVNYHNVTPPELFAAWDNALARHQVRAQPQLARLAGRAALGVAVSEVNRADLVAAGFAVHRGRAAGRRSIGRSTTASGRPGGTAVATAPAGRRPGERGGRVGWRSAGWRRTRRWRTRWPPSSPTGPATTPRPTLLSSASRRIAAYVDALRRYVADLGLADAVRFAGGRRPRRWRPPTTRPTCWWSPPSTRASACRWWRRWPTACRSVAYRQGALPEVLGRPGCWWTTRTRWSWPPPSHRLQTDRPWRARSGGGRPRRLPALGLADAGPGWSSC